MEKVIQVENHYSSEGIKHCATGSFGCRSRPSSIRLAGFEKLLTFPSSGFVISQSPFLLSFPMNKADLVNLVAARTELTKTDVSLVVDAAIDTIIDSVVEGKKVSILGFGSFEPRERSARQGLNPKTGEKIKIPAKRVPAFTAGKMFKDRVQG